MTKGVTRKKVELHNDNLGLNSIIIITLMNFVLLHTKASPIEYLVPSISKLASNRTLILTILTID